MTRLEFFAALRARLNGIPQDDLEERITFYGEMIDDRMEEGLTEAQAIEALGSIEEISMQIMAEIPLKKLVKEKVTPKRTLRAWEIVLLAPIWLSLLLALIAVVLSLYAVIWSVVISLWAAELSVAACSVGGVVAAVIFAARGSIPSAFAMLGAGLICGGFAILGFYGCRCATDGLLKLTKAIWLGLKACFVKKEGTK